MSEEKTILLSRRLFTAAGIYGLLALLPMYFLGDLVARLMPPAFNHPEFFYGFVGVAVAWQMVFLVIGRDPVRFRPLIPAALVEKFSFAGCAVVLIARGNFPAPLIPAAAIDALLGILFAVAFFRLPASGEKL